MTSLGASSAAATSEAAERISILLPLPLAGAYDYALPEEMRVAPGDFVVVPLGARLVIGVAWDNSLAHTAAVHFGDIPDPVSGEKSEVNLPAAQQMIDILALLEEKTRGNLTAEERQLLDQILYELRLRFVEAGKPQSRIITP